jgi:hypothetical protein
MFHPLLKVEINEIIFDPVFDSESEREVEEEAVWGCDTE